VITPADLLTNAERLISDAEFLFKHGRVRSAATLVVVALEQMGAFVETSTKAEYPDAVVHMDIFGKNANAHAKRQDALAAHVMSFALGSFAIKIGTEDFILTHGRAASDDEFIEWMTKRHRKGGFTEKQKQEMREYPDLVVANTLLQALRINRLQQLREYGLYEDANKQFSDTAVAQVIDLAAKVREILTRSFMAPDVIQIAGINMPEGLMIADDECQP
jgi:AbiV family abortive infection protein